MTTFKSNDDNAELRKAAEERKKNFLQRLLKPLILPDEDEDAQNESTGL